MRSRAYNKLRIRHLKTNPRRRVARYLTVVLNGAMNCKLSKLFACLEVVKLHVFLRDRCRELKKSFRCSSACASHVTREDPVNKARVVRARRQKPASCSRVQVIHSRARCSIISGVVIATSRNSVHFHVPISAFVARACHTCISVS